MDEIFDDDKIEIYQHNQDSQMKHRQLQVYNTRHNSILMFNDALTFKMSTLILNQVDLLILSTIIT